MMLFWKKKRWSLVRKYKKVKASDDNFIRYTGFSKSNNKNDEVNKNNELRKEVSEKNEDFCYHYRLD